MSVIFEAVVLVAAIQAFIYASIEAHRIHQVVGEETDVWFWVRLTTGMAVFLPFLHLLQVTCHSGACPTSRLLLPPIELLVLLGVMVFTLMTVFRLKQSVEDGYYPF